MMTTETSWACLDSSVSDFDIVKDMDQDDETSVVELPNHGIIIDCTQTSSLVKVGLKLTGGVLFAQKRTVRVEMIPDLGGSSLPKYKDDERERQIENFIASVYHLKEANETRRAIDQILDYFNNLIRKNDLSTCNEVLSRINVD